MAGYSRYVAIGDSQTEGLWDGDDTVGLRGFADRLAEIVDTHYPGLTYANLAVRGRRIRDLLDDQLPQALAMDPDLVTVCIGMNDVTRPGPHFDRALAELDDLHAQLAGIGRNRRDHDVSRSRTDPAGRPASRHAAAADQRCDQGGRRPARVPAGRPLRRALDGASRIPGAPTGYTGHRRATPYSRPRPPRRWVCLGSNHDWADASGGAVRQSLRSMAYSQALWTQNMLMPWMWRARARPVRRRRSRSQTAPIGEAGRPRSPGSPAGSATARW